MLKYHISDTKKKKTPQDHDAIGKIPLEALWYNGMGLGLGIKLSSFGAQFLQILHMWPWENYMLNKCQSQNSKADLPSPKKICFSHTIM